MTETLHFYTTGEAYMNLINGFYSEGRFKLFEELLGDGNLKHKQRVEAFKLRMVLEGSTQTDEGLSCHFLEESPKDFAETLYYAVRAQINDSEEDADFFDLEWIAKRNENLQVLLKYLTLSEIANICSTYILKEKGYRFNEPIKEQDSRIDGVILKDGRYILCGYQDHINLYPILYQLGLSGASDWTDCDETLHISSGELSGTVAHDLEDRWRDNKYRATPEQIATLWELRKHISGMYGGYNSENTVGLVRKYTIDSQNKGGKFGNLNFLRTYFPNIRLPKFSTELADFQDSEQVFMRTSPKHSLPGLLNSRLIKPTDHDFNKARNFIQYEFEKYSDIKHQNELHWFFQEFLEGSNGVCHIRFNPNLSSQKFEFTYQLSKNQGDVVGGKITDEQLTHSQEKELREIAETLLNEIDHSLQLEFVVHNEQIYIVQLRTLENEFEYALSYTLPENAITVGRTFSKGCVEVDVADILIVSEDADSKDLLNKKALIVETNVEFSHILALSKALRIPSIYGTGKVDFKGAARVTFNSNFKEGYITTL